ncbi:MAG: bifunctional DNA-binding transcriptional regulator/O6-methylguanine-DNA methyltransferase Ada [Acidimicrobiia bacterium]|nr:bifunctional DNA-binding transcriptional regulator/O6-methylguanine-DNA methyltransferase Ada [Acidimicrobiia bacterium]MYC45967.1 bifunctional DNA-binding transcriptional regulator/O6-methylguanine-DNA methyltransferase Ada [Acidimicrobiia bacterium]MYI18831.1 bifunctional DNA-binding transcriptional regulator/O6-methylguanine-DNA methyltransferase Ada [Acidimicrobiia bacterium]
MQESNNSSAAGGRAGSPGGGGSSPAADFTHGAALDDARWEAVAGRSAAADGLFIYGVRSTGIYCRPACPARRPQRRNVVFFATATEAAAAGFRACRRCRPHQGRDADPAAAAVIAACRRLEACDGSVNLADLARAMGWSPRHFRRLFRALTGVTPSAYARAQQADRARAALRSGAPVTDAVFDAGYGSTRAFYEHGAPRLGTSPSSYRQGSPGVHVRYSVMDTALGNILVAATASGVCAVRIGACEEDLLAELVAEFPRAHITCDDDGLAPVTAVVRALASGRSSPAAGRSAADIGLDLRGSAFQVEVWEALRTIAAGSVRSYAEVAAQIGRPDAARAVGGACAANPVALLVPCHRVLRSDGALGGYRWGTEIKAALLTAEAENTAASTGG